PSYQTSIFLPYYFYKSHGNNRDLHSFPTRRSSDLDRVLPKPEASESAFCGTLGCERSRAQGARHRLASRDQLARRRGSQLKVGLDRKSTRLNSSHVAISYAVFCLKKKKDGTVGQHR